MRPRRKRSRSRSRRRRNRVVTPRDINEAAEELRGIARRTPLVYAEPLGAYLKLENEQPIGAFKIRGAYNAIRKLPDAARGRARWGRGPGDGPRREGRRREALGRGRSVRGHHLRGPPPQGGGARR